MATPDPDQVRQNYTQTLVIGDVSTELRFNSDYDSENGTLTLQKSDPKYSEDANGNSFLQYTLTIATGNAAMPDVTVIDHFTQNEPAVEEYIGITGSSLSLSAETQPSETISGGDGTASQNPGTIILSSPKTDTSPGSFTWTIGAMRANETRTLTYQVKLRSGYAGAAGANNGVIKNTATPSSGIHQRSSVTSAFTPKAGATVSKNTGTITINTDTVTIPYTITVTASSTNTWTLRNVKISDDFGAYRTNLTKDQLKSVLLDNNGSWSDFRIYSGTDTSGNAVSAAERASEDSSSSEPYYVVKPSNENLGFNLYIGDLPAGESKTITFNVKLRKTVLDYIPGGTASSSSIQIGNRAGAYSDDTNKTYGNQTLGSGDTSSTVSTQQWDRKVQGTAITDAITQTAPDFFYSYSDNAWKESNSGESITIPAGSIQYQVAVNEKGLWNVSSTTFTDALSSNGLYLNYAGYLRLDYYSDRLGSSASFNSDQEAVNALSQLTPSKTAWLKIDSLNSFRFTPGSIGLDSAGTGAYLLTYYAKPVNTSSYSKTTAGNSFTLSGTVIGPGGTSILLSPISVSTSTLLSGSKNFSVSKSAWYGNIQDTSGGFSRGSLYWIITAAGTEIPAGLQLQDAPGGNQSIYGDIGTTPHVSIAGVYLSSVENADALTSAYTQISQIQNNNLFTEVSDNSWTWGVSGNAGIFTFNKAIDLNNQQLYIIVRTEPNANAFSTTQARPAATFINSLSMRNSSNESFTSVNSASMKIAQDGTNFKEVGEFGNYDASSKTWSGVTQVSGGNKPSDKILLSWATADGSTQYLSSGTYVDYRLVVNYAGNEEGTLRLEDVVPEGMEPVYVRYFWTAKYFWSTKKDDPSLQPEIAPITNLGDNWVDIGVKNAALDGNAGAATAGNLRKSAYGYYDSSTRTIKIEVSNLSRDTDSEDSVGTRDIQIQIVMRVTDPEVLKGTGKTFTNIMNVYSTAGSLVNSSSTGTKIAVTDSITKNKSGSDISGTTLSTSNQLQISFTMTVNPRGEDLLENSDTLTLVDSYSENLDINLSSLQVKESADSTENVSFTYQIDNSAHTLTLVIPDNKKLIISYDATIEAPLGTTIETISNEAYWYGYRSSKSKWSATKVKVEAAGSIDFGTTPIIKITKVDSQNALKTLEGAQFSLYETTYSETDKTFESTGNAVATETSNADGTVTFGASSSSYKLQFNKIYSIVETSAPTGYIRSSDPVYIGIFRTKTINNVTVYPKDMNNSTDSADVWNTSVLNDLASIANIYYTGTEYDYTWPNSRTSVRISKNFYDGTSNDPVTFPSGDFRFGLYYGGQLLQTLTISNANGQLTYLRTENGVIEAEDQPLFTGLNTNDVYTIAELDDNGNQIANAASATINGETYTVTYPNDSITFSTTDASVQTFSISNHTSVTISGTKTWDDNNNQDGKRPDHITVKLLADGNEVRSTVVNSSTSWAYSFNDLPKYRDGHEISYSVIEDAVPDYSTEITGYDITNSYTPGKTSVTVTKVWDDGNNQDGIRPESVQVQLYADGKASGDPVTLNSDGNWKYTWDNLDQMKSGTEIVYTAEEVTSIDGYTSSVSGNAAEGFTITNHHTPAEKTTVTEDTNSSGGDSSPSASTLNLVPDTADHTDVLRHGITAILSLTTALIAVVAYKRYQ
ncbi:MAG: Cna B-type domain-containing protein [Solobacterium sp.]|jgi:hypothetical protein|nr:Cna B-type domain-containing protein [Solobacterium sp.]